jgi:phospholipid-binding lipoprotein MlaA
MKIVALVLLFVLAPFLPAYAEQADAQPIAFEDFHDPFEEPSARTSQVADPLESVNRGSFWANDKIYTYVLRPFCEKVPQSVRQAIAEGMEWMTTPLRVAHMELAFTFRDGGSEIGRFVVRGLLSLLERSNPEALAFVSEGREDFDQAFGLMGLEPGCYLILPVLGPSTVRDGLGRLASLYVDPPVSLHAFKLPPSEEESLEEEMKTYAAIRETALDPYLFIRDAYEQQKQAKQENPRQHLRVVTHRSSTSGTALF